MDNWGGARWTYNRKPRKFFQKRKPIFQDERQHETWEFQPPIQHSTVNKDYKTILAKRIKQNRIKQRIVLFLMIIPLVVISFILIQRTSFALKKQDSKLIRIDAIQTENQNKENRKVYNFLIKSGNLYLKNRLYKNAIQEYELALRTGISTKSHYDDLLFASIMCCETTHKYCDRISHYEKIINNLK